MSLEVIRDKAHHGIGATPEQTVVLVDELEALRDVLAKGCTQNNYDRSWHYRAAPPVEGEQTDA